MFKFDQIPFVLDANDNNRIIFKSKIELKLITFISLISL